MDTHSNQRSEISTTLNPALKRELAQMHISELHAMRWSEKTAMLEDELDEAEASQDSTRIAQAEAAIVEHYRHEFDVEATRREILGEDEH